MREYYVGTDPHKRMIESVFLESFLFYSSFYLPMHFSAHAKLTNNADLIRLIIRDEAIHGYYIGYKFQVAMNQKSAAERDGLEAWAQEFMFELYENEAKNTHDLYDGVGLSEDVKRFLHYKANKALMNLGFNAMFSADSTNFSPAIMSAKSPGSDGIHDFFSGSDSSYVTGQAEATSDED